MPVGIQNENNDRWIFPLNFTPRGWPLPVIGRCHFRPVTDRLLVVGISGF